MRVLKLQRGGTKEDRYSLEEEIEHMPQLINPEKVTDIVFQDGINNICTFNMGQNPKKFRIRRQDSIVSTLPTNTFLVYYFHFYFQTVSAT